jgi:hypothetical protein
MLVLGMLSPPFVPPIGLGTWPFTHRKTESGYSVYWLKEINWLTRPNNDGVVQWWRGGITARTHVLPRSSPPARWRLSWQPLEGQCRPESGRKSPPTTSPIWTTTSTTHRRRSEAGLRGHALLGRGTSSTRSVPHPGNPSAGGARRHRPGHGRRGAYRTPGRLGPARLTPAGGGFSGGTNDPERPASDGSSAIARIFPGWPAFVRAAR